MLKKKTQEIPTAEELLNNYRFKAGEHIGNSDFDVMIEYAKKFAEIHVEAALKTAAESAKITTEYYHEDDVGITKVREMLNSADIVSERTDGDGILYAVDTYYINKESILNAYDKSLII